MGKTKCIIIKCIHEADLKILKISIEEDVLSPLPAHISLNMHLDVRARQIRDERVGATTVAYISSFAGCCFNELFLKN